MVGITRQQGPHNKINIVEKLLRLRMSFRVQVIVPKKWIAIFHRLQIEGDRKWVGIVQYKQRLLLRRKSATKKFRTVNNCQQIFIRAQVFTTNETGSREKWKKFASFLIIDRNILDVPDLFSHQKP